LPHPESRMTRTRIRVDSSPSVRFPTWNLMTGIYLEIGPWKFNTIFGPTRQTVKARSMPNTVGSHLSRRSSAKTEPPGRSPIIQVPPATATAHHHQSAAPRPHALFVPEGDRAQRPWLQPWYPRLTHEAHPDGVAATPVPPSPSSSPPPPRPPSPPLNLKHSFAGHPSPWRRMFRFWLFLPKTQPRTHPVSTPHPPPSPSQPSHFQSLPPSHPK